MTENTQGYVATPPQDHDNTINPLRCAVVGSFTGLVAFWGSSSVVFAGLIFILLFGLCWFALEGRR